MKNSFKFSFIVFLFCSGSGVFAMQPLVLTDGSKTVYLFSFSGGKPLQDDVVHVAKFAQDKNATLLGDSRLKGCGYAFSECKMFDLNSFLRELQDEINGFDEKNPLSDDVKNCLNSGGGVKPEVLENEGGKSYLCRHLTRDIFVREIRNSTGNHIVVYTDAVCAGGIEQRLRNTFGGREVSANSDVCADEEGQGEIGQRLRNTFGWREAFFFTRPADYVYCISGVLGALALTAVAVKNNVGKTLWQKIGESVLVYAHAVRSNYALKIVRWCCGK